MDETEEYVDDYDREDDGEVELSIDERARRARIGPYATQLKAPRSFVELAYYFAYVVQKRNFAGSPESETTPPVRRFSPRAEGIYNRGQLMDHMRALDRGRAIPIKQLEELELILYSLCPACDRAHNLEETAAQAWRARERPERTANLELACTGCSKGFYPALISHSHGALGDFALYNPRGLIRMIEKICVDSHSIEALSRASADPKDGRVRIGFSPVHIFEAPEVLLNFLFYSPAEDLQTWLLDADARSLYLFGGRELFHS